MVSGQLVAHVETHHSSVADGVTALQPLGSSATNRFGRSGDGAERQPLRTRASIPILGCQRCRNSPKRKKRNSADERTYDTKYAKGSYGR